MTDFTQKLKKWYALNRRDLPWRKTKDPYKIWLSEIILQQTRIEQGTSYYQSFVENYPTVFDLAAAPQQEVLKLWQGLGYYSRARNMHETASAVVKNYRGEFPPDFEQLLKLKGVGAYTAAAVASIAFNKAVAVIDGNVVRVLSRVFGIRHSFKTGKGKKLFEEIAERLLDKKDPGGHNQAMMDFGSVYCTPVNPSCHSCIFKGECFAFKNNTVHELPVKEKKISVKKRYFNYMVLLKPSDNSYRVYLRKRRMQDIWKNLYDFPLMEMENELSAENMVREIQQEYGSIKLIRKSRLYRHQLTHRLILARFFTFLIPVDYIASEEWISVDMNKLESFPVPRLVEKFLKDEQLI